MPDPVDRQEPAPLVTDSQAPTAAAPPTVDDWRDKRLGQLTARLHERNEVLSSREARIAELERELTITKQQATTATPPSVAGPTEQEIAARIDAESNRKAQTLAQQQAAQIEFNRQCNDVVAKGRQQYSDFDARLGDLRSVVIPGDRASEEAYWGIVSAAIKSGDPARIIHALGTDRNEAQRLMGLDPESRAIEVAKLSLRESENGALPKPVTPIGSRSPSHTAISPDDPDRADRLSTKEWMARREAQLRKSA